MFWIGFAAGTGICFLVCIVVISAVGTHAAAVRKESNERLYQYWDSTDANIKQYIVKMGEVAEAIRAATPWQSDPALNGFREQAYIATKIENSESV